MVDEFIVYYDLAKKYYYAGIREFGSIDVINVPTDVLESVETLNEDVSNNYLKKKEEYLDCERYLKDKYNKALDVEDISEEMLKLAYSEVENNVMHMKKINDYINNSYMTFTDVETSYIFDDIKLDEVGTFKAYLNLNEALKDNLFPNVDNIEEYFSIKDQESFEDFKESYLVNLNKENQLSFEDKDEPVFFAEIDYRSNLEVPTQHLIKVRDLEGVYTDYDVLLSEINDILKKSYQEGSISREFAITEINKSPLYSKFQSKGAEKEFSL